MRRYARGLQAVQLWGTHTRQPGFAAECKRQSSLLANDMQEAETLAWTEAANDTDAWKGQVTSPLRRTNKGLLVASTPCTEKIFLAKSIPTVEVIGISLLK